MDCTRLARRRLWLIALLAFCCVFLLPSWSHTDQGELENIQKAIKEKKAKWAAGETSVSVLPEQDRKKRVGALKPVLTEEDEKAAAEEQAALATLTAPPSYDWRAADGANPGNYITPVKNQGNCGSCWAFATTAGAESQVLLANQTPEGKIDLSEQLLVSCADAGNCGGGYIGTASDYIRDLGLPAETCFPYSATNDTCTNACADWTNGSYRISGWHYTATTNPTVEGLKNALYTYGPLVATMSVYSDFYYYTSGIYSYTSGAYQGGHAILIVGYSDAGQYFIVKNSWGTGWGEAGFFRIAYSELNSVVYFSRYAIAYEGSNPVEPAAPPDCTYSISPTGQTFTATGGSGNITVSSQSACAWTAVSNVAWMSVTSGNTGAGSGTVSYTVAANPNRFTRTGTFTIGGQTFTVTQKSAKPTKR